MGTFTQRVLVAADDEDTREMVVSALIEDGHEVVGVEGGIQFAECLEIIARDSLRLPDLIALDVDMPGPSGLELLASLRKSGWPTPVLMMTAFVSREVRACVEIAGAAAVVEKPFNRLELRAAALRARSRWRTAS